MRIIPLTALLFSLMSPAWAETLSNESINPGDPEIIIPDLPSEALPDIFKQSAEEPAALTSEDVNLVEVTETFYKITINADSGTVARQETNEAKPGDVIELVITAINKSSETVTDVQMENQVPQGPVQLLADSFKYDKTRSLYRISRSGNTYFPADAELAIEDINFIQWHILTLAPGETIEFSYQIKISP